MLKNMKQPTNFKFISAFMTGTVIYIVGSAINFVRNTIKPDDHHDTHTSEYKPNHLHDVNNLNCDYK